MDTKELMPLVVSSLKEASGGELFIEKGYNQLLKFQDGVLVQNSCSDLAGFSLRAFYGSDVLFTHSSDLSLSAVMKACDFIAKNKRIDAPVHRSKHGGLLHRELYCIDDEEQSFTFEKKVALLKEMHDYARSVNNKIASVAVMLSCALRDIEIIGYEGRIVVDRRPMFKLNVSVVLKENGKIESATSGKGGRFSAKILVENWREIVDNAVRKAEVNLVAAPCPAGEMTVVLGLGWPGVLLHEAVGHGLEADFNRKGVSSFTNKIGQSVASELVTVVDDGTIPNKRGSINVDDEGNSSQYNVLIEKGVLKGYMFDCINAELMHSPPTGNGRRESYMCTPMPRMTNTYMLPGDDSPEDIICSVEKGIYAVDFQGGQVDISSGKFVFSASESYLIENGQITTPVKGMTLIGDGPEVLKRISMVGNDLRLDGGVGTCGKDGQSVPVCVGQPTVKIDKITVGGTA